MQCLSVSCVPSADVILQGFSACFGMVASCFSMHLALIVSFMCDDDGATACRV